MKKKFTVIILLMALIAGAFAGCDYTASKNGPGNNNTLQSLNTKEENLDIAEEEIRNVSFEELIHIRATSIERAENADLYENVEQLLKDESEVLFQIVSGGEFSIQNDVVQGPHITVTKEGENGEWEETYIAVADKKYFYHIFYIPS